ncbi:hypothetical protein [Candidatus Enterococcus courvalinii]|uniref:Uncharacterized protein n=1 Tax=Candidatus Enterococcus courvalinii TaxID=2815329 RepID=A0ABS3I1P8_9ENTE|nr:hypothetical protein [Enterococcus sp. MSG2901]MBO0482571.1 hypothetical protein [Enterococcus sp. MSG2901]
MNHLVDGMFEILFFESNSRNKLHLFKYLVMQEQKISLKDIAKQFSIFTDMEEMVVGNHTIAPLDKNGIGYLVVK